ncbi:MAG TPA: hypothetical protein VHX60_17520 [Acidobacteriaceae bacterium]|nr:hypothetical protein [Acidobacteriaceae bacterium]
MTESVDAGISLPGFGSLSTSVQNTFSVTTTDSQSNTITKANSNVLSLAAVGDGVDHSQDQILLMLNPAITTASAFGLIDWQLGYFGPNPVFFPFTIAELKDPTLMTAGTQQLVSDAGLTQTDFDAIRMADPFADIPTGTPILDSNFDKTRFANVLSYAYKPTGTGQGCLVDMNQITNTYSSDQTSSTVGSFSTSYTVGVKSSSSSSPTGPPVPTGNLGFSAGTSITITNSATTTNSKSNTNTATVTLACPSSAYTGGELVDVYWDTLYGTFAFNTRDTLNENVLFKTHLSLPSSPAPGNIGQNQTAASGMPVVEFEYAGRRLRALPEHNGDVTFYGQFEKGFDFGILRYGGQQSPKAVPVGPKVQ